jgi:long-subunit fatty acid transport protein
LCTLLFTLLPPVSHGASGNALPRVTTQALGMADANVALASGAASQFINPANLLDSDDAASAWNVGAAIGRVVTEFSRPTAAGFGAAPRGDFDAKTQRPLVPYAAFTFAHSDRRAWGLSIESPHGLTVEWPAGVWSVSLGPLGSADIARKAELSIIRIGPAVSFKLSDKWRFGARVFAQHVDALDKNDLFTAEGDGLSAGAQLGMRYRSEKLIFAAAYTSRTNTKVKGSLRDIHPAAAATVMAGNAQADILLPDRLQTGIAWRLHPRLWWEFDLDWIGWSYVDELTIIQADGRVANTGRNARHNRDTLSVRTGLQWAYRPRLTLYAGLGEDPTPVPDRDATPVANMLEKMQLGLGGSYRLTNGLRLGFAYQFIRGHSRTVRSSDQDNVGGLETNAFEGSYESHTHIVAVSLAGQF